VSILLAMGVTPANASWKLTPRFTLPSLESGVSIVLAMGVTPAKRKLEAYATFHPAKS
jgi:hypothetical protein